jgi:hypothetical protein
VACARWRTSSPEFPDDDGRLGSTPIQNGDLLRIEPSQSLARMMNLRMAIRTQ